MFPLNQTSSPSQERHFPLLQVSWWWNIMISGFFNPYTPSNHMHPLDIQLLPKTWQHENMKHPWHHSHTYSSNWRDGKHCMTPTTAVWQMVHITWSNHGVASLLPILFTSMLLHSVHQRSMQYSFPSSIELAVLSLWQVIHTRPTIHYSELLAFVCHYRHEDLYAGSGALEFLKYRL